MTATRILAASEWGVHHGAASGQDTAGAVEVAGLGHPRLRVAHLSDSHVSCGAGWMAERESFGLPPFDPIHTAYTDGKDETATDTITTMAQFRAQVAALKDAGADLIIHTGDLLNMPTAESVQFVHEVLTDAGLPWLFTCGNHDWCYEGLGGDRRSMTSEAGRQAVRAEWRERRLGALFEGKNPSHWVEEVHGLTFIGLDNSTCMVNEEQHDFFRAAHDAAPGAVVLLLHVPLFIDELKVAMTGEDGEGYYCVRPPPPPPPPLLQPLLPFQPEPTPTPLPQPSAF